MKQADWNVHQGDQPITSDQPGPGRAPKLTGWQATALVQRFAFRFVAQDTESIVESFHEDIRQLVALVFGNEHLNVPVLAMIEVIGFVRHIIVPLRPVDIPADPSSIREFACAKLERGGNLQDWRRVGWALTGENHLSVVWKVYEAPA